MKVINVQAYRIETDRLVLRAFCDKDYEHLAALNGDPETMKYISPPLGREIVGEVMVWVRREWKRWGYGWFALFEKRSGNFIGQCGLQNLEGKRKEEEVALSFVISRLFWGRGFATEAGGAVLNFGFSKIRLPQIIALTVNENIPSQRVLKKLGFTWKENRNIYQRSVGVYSLKKEDDRTLPDLLDHVKPLADDIHKP